MAFNFSHLVTKWATPPIVWLEETPGYFDYTQGGVWVPGTVTETQIQGVILPLSDQELQFGGGGTYSTQDKKMYAYFNFKVGDKVKHRDDVYMVHGKKDYSDFDSNLHVYILKRGE